MTSFADLSTIVNKITTNIKNAETLAVPVLVSRLDKLAHANPDDQTVVGMYRVLSKFDDNKKHLISRALFTDLYNKHYTTGTKFAAYFVDELIPAPEAAKPVVPAKDAAPLGLYDAADPVLASALGGLFGDVGKPVFSKDAAMKASKVVGASLELWNLAAQKLSIAAGDDKFLAVQADYDTPKGTTSVLVPVEVIAGKVMAPMVFVANAGVKELNNANLKGYLTSNAGVGLEVRAEDVVKVLSKAGAEQREVGSVEMALIRMNAKDNGIMCANSILGQKLDDVGSVVATPKAEGYEKLSAKLDTPMGLAVMKFGQNKVDSGRDVVSRALVGLGVKGAQVVVSAVANDAVVYAVVANGTGFNVPVRITEGKVEMPSVMICNGSIMPLDKASMSKIGGGDIRAVAAVSPQYGLRTSDLIDNVRKAVSEENYAKAEDALNVLASSGDKDAYKKGLDAYRGGLGGAKEISKCAFVVQSKSSNQAICGHTGLPLNKVFQDKDGNCAPLYHREIQENAIPAAFSAHKIHW